MKDIDKNADKRGADNIKYRQEDAASRDYAKQREAGAKQVEAEAKKAAAKKPSKSGK
jgi:hypothetical protein